MMSWLPSRIVKAKLRSLRGVGDGVYDCDIEVSELKFLSRYYVHFRGNTHGKGMNTIISVPMGLIVPLLFFNKDGFGLK